MLCFCNFSMIRYTKTRHVKKSLAYWINPFKYIHTKTYNDWGYNKSYNKNNILSISKNFHNSKNLHTFPKRFKRRQKICLNNSVTLLRKKKHIMFIRNRVLFIGRVHKLFILWPRINSLITGYSLIRRGVCMWVKKELCVNVKRVRGFKIVMINDNVV